MSTYNNALHNNAQEQNVEISPEFKGIWIPREICLRKDLSATEKCLWSLIHSLHDKKKGGCWASNDYLLKFVDVSERRLREYLALLKEKKLLIQSRFGNGERILKAVTTPENVSFSSVAERDLVPEKCEISQLGVRNLAVKSAESRTLECEISHFFDATHISYRKEDIKEDRKNKQKEDGACAPVSAFASTSTDSFSESIFQQKETASQKKQEIPKASSGKISFSSEVISTTEILIDLTSQKTEYIVPSDTTGWQKEVKILLEDENRDRHQVIKTFTWCLTANWYSSQLLKKRNSSNPIKYFRENYAELAAKMLERPFEKERKFSPSTTKEGIEEITRDMMSRAIY